MSEQRPSSHHGVGHKRELSNGSEHSEQQRRLQTSHSQAHEHLRPSSSSRHSSSRHDEHPRLKRSPPGTTSPSSSHGEGSSRGAGPTWKTESHDRRHDSASPHISGDDDGHSPRPVTPGTNIAVNRNQPAFISKLYAMLQDPKYTEANLIYWAPDGRSFICPNPIEFARDVLPNFYKTNNFQSFVRQLNMYSFNKVSDLCSATQSDPSAWEFRHPLFCRDEPEKIHLIQRKAGGRAAADRRPTHASPGDDGMHGARPSTTGHMFNSPQRPHAVRHSSAPRISDNAMYHPAAAHPPARYDERQQPFRYEREPQTTYWNHNPAPAPPPAAQAEGDVAALERELQFLWGKMQAERHEAARQSLDLHGHLLRMADMVAELSPNVGDELYTFRSDVFERYKQLQRQVADGQRYLDPAPPVQQPPSSSHSSSSHHIDRYHPYRRASPEERPSRPSSSRYEAVPRAYPPLPYERYGRYGDEEDRYYRHGSEPRHRRLEERPPPADPHQPASLRNILH